MGLPGNGMAGGGVEAAAAAASVGIESEFNWEARLIMSILLFN